MKSKKMWLIVLIGIILMSLNFVSAWEWDNVKSYDEETKTITITNALGLGIDLIKIQLIENTEHCSNDCYSIMEIDNYEEIRLSDKYDETFDWDFENLKTLELEDISHNFKIAYSKSQIEEQVGEDCKQIDIIKNLTECSKIVQTKEIYNWEDYKFENNVLPVGKYWLKLEGQKSYKEIIDWQPTLIGVNLKDVWAKWGDVTAIRNFTFDGEDLGDDTGTADVDTTDTGITQLTTGCIDGYCANLEINAHNPDTYKTQATTGAWCFWFKPNINTSLEPLYRHVLWFNSGGYDKGDYWIYLNSGGEPSTLGTLVFYTQSSSAGSSIQTPQDNFVKDIWYQFCAKINATGFYEFVNGVEVNMSTAGAGDIGFGNAEGTEVFMFARSSSDINYTPNWVIDEAKFFNVEISSEQILDMYNTELPIEDTITHITNCTDLQNMQNNLTESYVLDNNIDCSDTINWNDGKGFNPIGNSSSLILFDKIFNGSLNGQNYNITNLSINRTTYFNGLIGVCFDCSISNLNLINANIQSSSAEVGGLMGWNKNGVINNCSSTGLIKGISDVGGLIGFMESGIIENSYSTAIINGNYDTGGLIGYFENGIVNNSYTTGNVTGYSAVGGLIGFAEGDVSCLIENSYATGNVNGVSNNIGGLMGWNKGGIIENSYATGNVNGKDFVGGLTGHSEYGIIKNSYATGNVNGKDFVGGLIGINRDNRIENSYATGNIIGTNYVGGLIGKIQFGNIYNSYSVGYVNGIINVGGLVGYYEYYDGDINCINSYWDNQTSNQSTSACGEGKTSAKMIEQSTFVDWDFDNVWNIEPTYYPCLRFNCVLFAPPPDTIPPHFTDETPQSQTLTYNTALNYDINATDETAFDCFAVNDTKFKINCDGLLQNNTMLGVDIYYLNITINDTSNNLNSTIMYVNVTKAPRTCILETDKDWTREYDGTYSTTACNVSEGNDDGVMNFTKNLIAVSSPDFQTNTGEFNYSCEWIGGQNYSDCQETNTLIISNGTGVIFAYINNSRANFNADNRTKNTPLNATLQIGTGTIEMYLDGILINSGISPLSNITDLPIGYYNLTAIYGGNENYTEDMETWWINITEYTEIPAEVEFEKNFPNEFAPPTERAIYDIMRTTGAGITLFTGFVSHSLPTLIILLMFVGIIIVIGYALVKIIKWRR